MYPADMNGPSVSRRAPSARAWITAAILLFWVTASGWLLRTEAFPGRLFTPSLDYRAIVQDAAFSGDTWTRLTYRDRVIGFNRTRYEVTERDPEARYLIEQQAYLKLKLLGRVQTVRLSAEAGLDDWQQLVRFSFDLSSALYALRAEGRRVGSRLFEVNMSDGRVFRAVVPEEAVVAEPFMSHAMKSLRPGDRVRLRRVDPLSLQASELTVTAHAWGSWPGRTNEALSLSMEYQGLKMPAWMDRDGRLVRQETPWGITLELCEAGEALAWMGGRVGDADAPDLLGLLGAAGFGWGSALDTGKGRQPPE